FTVYGELKAPNGLSGLAPMLLVIRLYISTILTSLKDVKYLTFLLILETAFFLMAKFSYAGLRFQYLTLFAFLCILPRCAVMRSPDRAIFLALIFTVGILGFASKARNIVDGANVGDSPFIPYQLFWEK
ncbi:MAG: hypothetical protein JWR17_405, partial [Pseudomonas sp.]|uniref:hypothetical protein n=1 Tax=Pseudomonas sp. TaxID=306 RepID=UPI002618357D